MSVAAGATALVVDILTNTSQLGTGLAQAEAQITTSANRMGKQMESAGGGMAEGILRSFVPKLTLALGVTAADRIVKSLKEGMQKRTLQGEWILESLQTGGSYIPVAGQVADMMRPYGEQAGRGFMESFFEALTAARAAQGGLGPIIFGNDRFFEGTEFGLMDWLNSQLDMIFGEGLGSTRPLQPFGVPMRPNENLIVARQEEYARLTAEQQILNQQDIRSQMVERRIQVGMGQVGTALGTFSMAFGDPADASRRVYDAAMKQVVALDRIKSIVEEMGEHLSGRN